jgi:hypothetical protein
MGHNYLGNMPRTYRWKEVIRLLSEEGSVSEIADASLTAAKTGLQRIPSDEGFTQTLTIIFKFIESARSRDIESALMQNGFSPLKDFTVFDLSSCLKEKFDFELSIKGIKSDVSEIAQNSFTETIFKYLSAESKSLFDTSSETIKTSLRRLASGTQFRGLMHEFYSTFTRRYLTYHLSRELPHHVGPNSRFQNIDEHIEFNKAFNQYINQAIRIADDFTPGWFGKAQYEKNLTHDSISRYAHVAFKKILKEFSRDES